MESILYYLNLGVSTVVPFVVLLGILIFVHELGHFLVARWCGVRVEVFSLGFGKKLLKFKRGDTTYALSLIPLGGYVKMFGEQPGDHITEDDRRHSFTHKNVWQRIAIVIAGPLMNFIFAVVLFFTISMMGEDARKPVIGDVATGSAAYQAGFRSGDTLLKVNEDLNLKSWEDLQRFLSLNEEKNQSFRIQVKHENSDQVQELNVTAIAKPNPNILSRFDYIAEVDGLTPLSKGTTVGVPTTSPLYALGMRTGDTITAINGQPIQHWRDLEGRLTSLNANEPLVLDVEGLRVDEKAANLTVRGSDTEKNNPANLSDSKKFTLTMAPTKAIKSYSLANLGIESSELYLSKVMEKSPAADAGLKAGDRVSAINNVKINEWEDVITNIKSYDGKAPVDVLVTREGQPVQLKITPKMSSQMTQHGTEEKRYTIGIVPYGNLTDPDIITLKADGAGQAFVRGISRTWDVSVMTVLSFVRLFQNKISPKHIGGVISIGQAASETYKMGMSQFMQMMAIISVNLFVLNLLPIPVLDGGHLLFYIIEVVKGAPVSLRKMEVAQQVGLAVLMSLMIFALFNDFTRLLGL